MTQSKFREFSHSTWWIFPYQGCLGPWAECGGHQEARAFYATGIDRWGLSWGWWPSLGLATMIYGIYGVLDIWDDWDVGWLKFFWVLNNASKWLHD